jgi:hypothetical protein
MYSNTGIGDVTVRPFPDEEAEQLAQAKPDLRKLLFGNAAVRDIARRPFLPQSLPAPFQKAPSLKP